MIYLVATIHVIVAIFLILVVLLQRGSGADLSVFGGGGTQAAFGARSAASLLHKMTVWGFVAFTITTISYNFLAGGKQQESVLSGAAAAGETAVEEPVAGEAPAEQPAAEGPAGAQADEGAAGDDEPQATTPAEDPPAE